MWDRRSTALILLGGPRGACAAKDIVAESAAVGLYIAQKAGKLIPSDFHGRTRETQWCFAAMNTRVALFQIALDRHER